MANYSREKPYISFVATSRNDNHGGDTTFRMQMFVRGLIHQCNTFQLPAELVMVEWNPPTDKPLLHTILPKTTPDDFLSIRYIQVPPEEHKKFRFSDCLYLFQMIAKNVGIRRAKAPFVVCTNIDLLFEDRLIKMLAEQNLQEGHYYRANRCDIPNGITAEMTVPEMLDFARSNPGKTSGKSNWYPHLTNTTSFLFRYWGMIPFFWLHDKIKRFFLSKVTRMEIAMDTEACGDFTMMSKNDWIRMAGYPEFEVYSLHIDSMGLIAANAIGLKQVIFPWNARTYHVAHDNGWEFHTKRERLLFFTNKPVLEWWSIHKWSQEVLRQREDVNFNGPEWGLNNLELEEITA